MALITKENAKEGLKIFACHDDRPLDGYGYSRGVITKIYDDHYLYDEIDGLKNIWGFYLILAENPIRRKVGWG